MEVCECDVLYARAYAKYNDNYRYIILDVNVFSKFLYLIPIKTMIEPSITSAFRSIFDDGKYSKSRRRQYR